MKPNVVPSQLIKPGLSPQRTDDAFCKDCKAPYTAHSGDVCWICRYPVEHHQDAERMRVEIEGAARLARASLDTGRTIRPYEEWCIKEAT